MDPMTNPTPTSSPAPGVPPVPPSDPTPVAAPAANPISNPVPVANSTPAVGPAPMPGLGPNPAPVNPVFQPTKPGVAATDPIMMPEPAPAPDPVEEELKAPMKAADPVPGSIGSAISGPGEATGGAAAVGSESLGENPFAAKTNNTPSVAFNDPAKQPDSSAPAPDTAPAKKKTSKNTLIALVIIFLLVAIALGAVLAFQLMGGGNNNQNTSGGQDSAIIPNESDDLDEPDTVPATGGDDETSDNSGGNSKPSGSGGSVVLADKTLSCTKNMTEKEIVGFKDAISGTVSITAEFNSGTLDMISMVKSVVYSDDGAASNEPVEMEVHEYEADELTSSAAKLLDLPISTNGKVNLALDAIQVNYEDLDFTCEVL